MPDRLAEQRLKSGERLLVRELQRLAAKRLGNLRRIPVNLALDDLPAGDVDPFRRPHLFESLVDRMRAGHVTEAQISGEAVAIDLGTPTRMREEALRLRSEEHRVCDPAVVERLLADPIADETELALGAVPQRDREHADKSRQRPLDAPSLECCEDHLGVGVAAEDRALRGKLAAQLRRIIDLAVEHDDEPAPGRNHRLVAGGREIDDRQTPETDRKACRRIAPRIGVVRPAMGDRVGHSRRDVEAVSLRNALREVDESRKTTHRVDVPRSGRSRQSASLHTRAAQATPSCKKMLRARRPRRRRGDRGRLQACRRDAAPPRRHGPTMMCRAHPAPPRRGRLREAAR